ncbi:MAG: dehydrogenase [Proteobacteria bacterium]|nr:dehydrogenase [Pseudomonadota bacterium]NIS68770.1 dehydrogenase [Pseudomonadota bacterium]
MPRNKVYNWQIKRETVYPFEGVRSQKQFAAVFDINKCIACQTCTMACKQTWTTGKGQDYMFWNNVESKPYGFYPLAWDVKLLGMLGPQKWDGETFSGKTIFEAAPRGQIAAGYLPDAYDYAYPNVGEDEPYGTVHQGDYITVPHRVWHFYLARICNHCTYAACLASCPRKAIYKRPEDGIVLVDQKRCRGYRECVRACPYKRVFFNKSTKISEKCIACYPKVEEGTQTQCITTCIGRIRLNGWIHTPDQADPENPIDYLVHVKKAALPLFPQFGLEPNIYYIPPVHVPPPFSRQMFGPGVERAVQAYQAAQEDRTLLAALTLFGSTEFWISRFKLSNGLAIGFDDAGTERVRVPLMEPVYIRPFYDEKLEVYRHNIT